MLLRHKRPNSRKDSNSREHHSNLRNNSRDHNSRSLDKNKHRSNSKATLRFKNTEQPHPDNTSNSGSHNILNRITLKKNGSSKQIDTSNEYYSHFRGKSKSKGKLQGVVE